MPIEPHAVTTVHRRPPVGMDKPRTLAEYQADLIRRFGKVPSWAELAKRENTARWHHKPASTMARSQTPAPPPPAPQDRYETMRQTWAAKVDETKQTILNHLTKPMTSGDMSRVTGMTFRSVHERLAAMAAEGLIIRRLVKSVAVWERRQEAAE